MARKRKNKEITMLSNEDKLQKAKELRLRKAGITVKQLEENTREEFRKYFAKIKRTLSLSSDMEEIVWLHLKSTGFNRKDKFDDGLRHFGYKF